MQDRRLSDDYGSLMFKYCDVKPEITINLSVKLVIKSKSRVIFNNKKKNRLGHPLPQKKTIGSEDGQIIQNWETNRRKTSANQSKTFLFRGLLFDASDAITRRAYTFERNSSL